MIHRIRIQNFRSIRDVTVQLGPVTVLIGRSGSGKTNFVDAIRYFRDLVLSGGSSQENIRPLTQASAKSAPSLEMVFNVPGVDGAFTYKLKLGEGSQFYKPSQSGFGFTGGGFTGNGSGFQNHMGYAESLAHDEVFLFATQAKDAGNFIWLSPPETAPLPEPATLSIRTIQGLGHITNACVALQTGIAAYDFPSDVLLRTQDSRSAGFDESGGNFLYTLRQLWLDSRSVIDRKSLHAALRRINPRVASVALDSIDDPKKVNIGHRFGSKVLAMDLAHESSGFRRFFAHLLALYQSPPRQFMAFEEPENGIFPGALELLAEEFKAAPGAGRGQILLTTHNPEFLNHFEPEQIRVVELDENLETQIGPVSEEQLSAIRDQLLHTGELLTVDPARRAGAEEPLETAQ